MTTVYALYITLCLGKACGTVALTPGEIGEPYRSMAECFADLTPAMNRWFNLVGGVLNVHDFYGDGYSIPFIGCMPLAAQNEADDE